MSVSYWVCAAVSIVSAAVSLGFVQLADAVVGVLIHERMKTVGPADTGLVNLAALNSAAGVVNEPAHACSGVIV